jgi:hypothetical protein
MFSQLVLDTTLKRVSGVYELFDESPVTFLSASVRCEDGTWEYRGQSGTFYPEARFHLKIRRHTQRKAEEKPKSDHSNRDESKG